MDQFALPDVGEGLTEAEIVTWRVSVGDTVGINDILVDIETAKSIVELPSPFAGEVQALHVSEGETVAVGTPIISIGSAEAAAAFASVATAGSIADDATADAVHPPSDPPQRQAVLVGYGPRTDTPTRRRRKVDAGPQKVASVDTEKVPQRPLRSLAKPPVRKLARDLGVDLSDVSPAVGDVITRADVQSFAGRQADTAPAPAAAAPRPDGDELRIPVKGVRKRTAEAMVASAFTAPHVTEWITIDATRTVELVARLKADRAFEGVKVSPTLIVAKAVCLAMRRTPELNARWDEAAQEIVVPSSVTLGIAAATERGLVVPTIPGASAMSLVELAAAITELTATARAGRTQPAQMAGGTFSLTNIGVFGVDAGTPILNPGQAGILAMGAISRRPWIDDDDQVVPRWVTTLTLSFDHRVVDGEQGSRFLADVAAIVTDPARALTY